MSLIEMRDISLTYPVLGAADRSLKSSLREVATGGIIRRAGRSIEVKALDSINLTAHDGERIGIIGHNGAGKTTLLKVMAGVYRAQKGAFRREGRLVAVISPASGMKMNITGYENIENLGLLSGLTTQEIRAKIPDIAEFAELGDFLGLSVETYSAGMKARLAFAVATALSPDILLLDENLATGDARFFNRARKRMEEMIHRSNILVLASHSMTTLTKIVDRVILLEHGRIIGDGPVDEIIEMYKSSTGASQTSAAGAAIKAEGPT